MKRYFLHSLKIVLIILSGWLGLLMLYLLFAFILSIIPVNNNFEESNQSDLEIYLLSNGVHLDIVLPKVNKYKDWRKELQIDPFIEDQVEWIAFGWGDREFYLNTPEWSDLTFRTAFRALFLKDSSAIHITYFKQLETGKRCKKLHISKEQYLELVGFIEESLYHDEYGQTVRIKYAGYHQFDQFYEANRSYNLFYTCNTWSNKALKRSGMRSCVWTPFDRGLLWQYKHN